MTDSLELRAIAEQARRKAALLPDSPARGVLEVMAREMDRDAERLEREEQFRGAGAGDELGAGRLIRRRSPPRP